MRRDDFDDSYFVCFMCPEYHVRVCVYILTSDWVIFRVLFTPSAKALLLLLLLLLHNPSCEMRTRQVKIKSYHRVVNLLYNICCFVRLQNV